MLTDKQRQKLEKILDTVDRPSRYIGGELNAVSRKKQADDMHFAFCFPDTYEVAMSHLGMKILYDILNNQSDTLCERVCMPWSDMAEKLKQEEIPLFSLENKVPLYSFDIVGFTLQYEMSYTNILHMLELGGIEVLNRDRKEDAPIIVAGGPCACNPEPLSEFIDAFSMGDGETAIVEMTECVRRGKKAGKTRKEIIESLSEIEGMYVPSLYNTSYNEDGTIKKFKPIKDNAPYPIKRRIEKNIETLPFPKSVPVPFTQAVHDRIVLEIMRGCTQGCRFCQAGMLYRPVRERSCENLLDLAKCQVASTGYEEISLSSLSTGDYSQLEPLVKGLMDEFEQKRVSVSLPSLRLDSKINNALKETSRVKKSSLTLAPEAGTQRLRDVINKRVTEEDLMRSVSEAFILGYSSVKLYFMIGLPTETYEDLDGIADLAQKVSEEYFRLPKGSRPRGLRITVSTSNFVPKPFTPFQWAAQDSLETLIEKQKYLKQKLIKIKGVQYNWHEAELSLLEACLAKGDRRMTKALYLAFKDGAMLDSWREYFSFERWQKAFENAGIDMPFYANRERDYDEILPWDLLDIGIRKNYLKRENERAKQAIQTQDCRQNCNGCGLQKIPGVCKI
ncbi:MAG: TIGR03960 family B12-binding radical SAM protein [Eubacteriales bacterium]|nr:TIGR03960 family B12-binding radical SAM protein [Eubacteriales bacterium]